ncbi:hypothetical protein IWZ00DRAFT_486835 [Phyllosticta capitalensis]
MSLSADNKISIVSVIGLYIGILVTLSLGAIQIWQQLKQRRQEDLESGPDSDEEEEEEHDLDPSERSMTNLNPAEPLEQHRSSFTSTNTLPGHTGHHRRSSIELFCFHPSVPDNPDSLSLALDPTTPRPPLACGISAPLFLD